MKKRFVVWILLVILMMFVILVSAIADIEIPEATTSKFYVNDFTDAEESTVPVLKPAPEDNSKSIFARILIVIVFSIFLIYFVFSYIKLYRNINSLTDENDEKDVTILTLKQEIRKLERSINVMEPAYERQKAERERIEEKYAGLEFENKKLEDWKRRICILHSESEYEVADMIKKEIFEDDKKKAREYDERCSKLLNIKVTREMYISLDNAISRYESLNESQRGLVKTNIFRLKKMYEEAIELKEKYEGELEEQRNRKLAKRVQDNIKRLLFDDRANAEDLESLKNGFLLYKNLNPSARRCVDESYVFALKRLINKAQEDYDRIEEEKERKNG